MNKRYKPQIKFSDTIKIKYTIGFIQHSMILEHRLSETEAKTCNLTP